MVTDEVPTAVGVPDTAPDVLMARPAGSVCDGSLHEYVPEPPVAANWIAGLTAALTVLVSVPGGVIVSCGVTVQTMLRVAARPDPSTTCTVDVTVPMGPVTVPLMIPSVVMLMPVGKAPLTFDQVYGG